MCLVLFLGALTSRTATSTFTQLLSSEERLVVEVLLYVHTNRRLIIIIIMYIYHALINALSAHMIHINLSMIFYTHVEHSPTKRFT